MNQRIRLLLGACLASVLFTSAVAAEKGTLLRNADLKAKPFLDAESVAKIPERAQVEVLARQGPWMQVRYEGKQGYVRMLQVRLDASDTAVARRPSSASVAVNRPVGGTTTATTGVRGFDEAGLMAAEPAPEQFKLMVSFAATPGQAQQFAQAAQLASRKVPYYDAAGKPEKGGK
jgi:hypothetical protein